MAACMPSGACASKLCRIEARPKLRCYLPTCRSPCAGAAIDVVNTGDPANVDAVSRWVLQLLVWT